jgi:hypothetical protein
MKYIFYTLCITCLISSSLHSDTILTTTDMDHKLEEIDSRHNKSYGIIAAIKTLLGLPGNPKLYAPRERPDYLNIGLQARQLSEKA